MSAIAHGHEIITERELARLEADGWRNTSPEGRGLWIAAGWMVSLGRPTPSGVPEYRTVIVAVDEELADSRVISGDGVDGAHSGESPTTLPTTQPQRNAGTPAPEPFSTAPWMAALAVVVSLGAFLALISAIVGGAR